MKRKITLSIALVLSIILVSLMISDSTANAEPRQRFKHDTGVVTLGQNQILRVTTVSGQGSGDPIPVEIITFNYMQTACSGGICRQAVSSQTTSQPFLLAPNEAAVVDAGDVDGNDFLFKRVVVISGSRNTRVNTSIIDAVTGEVVSFTTDLVIDVSG